MRRAGGLITIPDTSATVTSLSGVADGSVEVVLGLSIGTGLAETADYGAARAS